MIEVPVWLIVALAVPVCVLCAVFMAQRAELREARELSMKSSEAIYECFKSVVSANTDKWQLVSDINAIAKDRDALRNRCAALEAELAELNQERGEL